MAEACILATAWRYKFAPAGQSLVGHIEVVIGLKVDPASSDASLTVWCPNLEAENGITLVGYEKSVDGRRQGS
jgi:hypothetical protein